MVVVSEIPITAAIVGAGDEPPDGMFILEGIVIPSKKKDLELYPKEVYQGVSTSGVGVLRDALYTDGRTIDAAFSWASTPQGHAYWRNVTKRSLSDRDRLFIKELIYFLEGCAPSQSLAVSDPDAVVGVYISEEEIPEKHKDLFILKMEVS